MAAVTLQGLAKEYPGGHRAVKGIDLEVAAGEFLVLVGPSGCGKSTVLRLIAGLERPTGGSILIGGKPMDGVPPKERDIAMVFQNYALYPHLSVRDNLAFGLRMRRTPRAEVEARVGEAAALLGLEGCLDRKPKTLSGGQRQRVALGRAIVRRPKVFLFDEPLSNLDAQMRVAMRAEISRLHGRLGATMIYVTHDQVEAMTMGDRVCLLRAGEVQQVAGPLELYRRPSNLFVAGFIGSPPMNFFRGRARRSGAGMEFAIETGGDPLLLPLPADLARRAEGRADKPLTLGIRPEDLAETADPAVPALEGVVEMAEPTGAETHLYLRRGSAAFVARVRSEERPATGRSLRMAPDWPRAHLFDSESGTAL